MCVVVPDTSNGSPTDTGWVSCNSVLTVYLVIVSDSPQVRTQSHKAALCFRLHLQAQIMTCGSDQLVKKWDSKAGEMVQQLRVSAAFTVDLS